MNESRKYDLFGESVPESETPAKHQPLAERFRPRNLDEFIGQEHIVGENGFLREIISKDAITSLIFWGPPGSDRNIGGLLVKVLTTRYGLKTIQSSQQRQLKLSVSRSNSTATRKDSALLATMLPAIRRGSSNT